ncbi:MAG: hypothetical protein MUC88_13125 [Planctomycetes bacterium]|nr:hypothetical protein [Planctomycetota bacterium]
MSENESEFRKMVAGLRIDAEPNSVHRDQLRRQMLQAFERAGVGRQTTEDRGQKAVRRDRPPSTVSHLPLGRLAIAAAVLIAGTLGAWSLLGRGPTSFQQVRLATQRMPWLYAVVSRCQGPDVRTERHWYDFAAQKAFAVMDDSSVVGWEYGVGARKLVYNPRVQTLQIGELSGAGVNVTENLVSTFAAFASRDKVTRSTAQREGQTVLAFEYEKSEPGLRISNRVVNRLKIALMAEPRTRRVVAARVEYEDGGGSVLAREDWVMSYPSSGPATVYDLNVPAWAGTTDTRQRPIGTPSDAPTAIGTPAPTSGLRLAPLEIRLPKPTFTGTSRDFRLPNLERPRGAARPPFLAPIGTMNVALGKPVSSSDPEPVIGSLDAITDGDKEALEGSFVELSPGPQSITLDLQEQCEVYAVVVWHYHRWQRAYVDVLVQVAQDPAFKTGVRTIFNNDADNSLGLGAGTDLSYVETYEGKLIDGKGAQGRYVRLFTDGNTHDDLNHYIEVEVYGRPSDK